MTRLLQRLSAVLFGTGAALAAGKVHAGAIEVPPRQVGPFEIVAVGKRVGNSARFLRSGNPFGTLPMREYTVRHRGKSLVFPGSDDRVWQALHLADSARPALLLTSGPKYALLTEVDGAARMTPLAPESGSSRVQWLDADGGQPGPVIEAFVLDRAEDPPKTQLVGGRWLYLRNRVVLDVHTLRTVVIDPWWREGRGEQIVEMGASNGPAIALSPGQTSFVLAGQGRDYRRGGEEFAALLIVDLATGNAEGLRVDERMARLGSGIRMDAAWLGKHFRWERGADGRERLVPR